MWVSGLEIAEMEFLITEVLMPSWPVLFLLYRFLTMSSISFSSTGVKKNKFGSGWLRKSVKDSWYCGIFLYWQNHH